MTSIPRGTLVELLDQYSTVYPVSPTGARGWIRAKRELPDTEPEVYIEWDKGHWRYHGEKDGWTFEHHFRPVVEEDTAAPSASPTPQDMTNLASLIRAAQQKVEEERCPNCGELHDTQSEFIDAIADAQDSLIESDAFFIVSVHPEVQGSQVLYEPRIYSQALDETSRGVVEAQLLNVAVQLFERHLANVVRGLEDH